MTTSRKYHDELFDALKIAFSKEVSGATDEAAFAKWLSIVQSNFLTLSRYLPTTYLQISQEFENAKTATSKNELLKLCNYLYRIALSMDLLDKLESENRAHVVNIDRRKYEEQIEKNALRTQDKPILNVDYIQEEIKSYELKLNSVNATKEIQALATRHVANIFNAHAEKIAILHSQINTLENKLAAGNNAETLEELQRSLVSLIQTNQQTLLKDLAFSETKSEKPAILHPFNRTRTLEDIEIDREKLEEEIADLNKKLSSQQKPDAKESSLQNISNAQWRDLIAIQKLSEEDRNHSDKTQKIINTLIDYQYSYLWRYLWPKWEALKLVALKLHAEWTTNETADAKSEMGPKSINQRVQNFLNNRKQLLAAQEAAARQRIAYAEIHQQQLNAEVKKLSQLNDEFCKRTNKQIFEELQLAKKNAKSTVQDTQRAYDNLLSRVESIKIRKILEDQQKKKKQQESKDIMREPLIPKVVEERKSIVQPIPVIKPIISAPPSKAYRGWGFLGTVFLGGAVAAGLLLTWPVSLIVGGCCAVASTVSFVKTKLSYNQSRKKSSPPSFSNTRKPGKTSGDIQLSLRSQPIPVKNARALGLNPDKAQVRSDGLQFSLRNGMKLCFLNQGGTRLYSHDQQHFRELGHLQLTSQVTKHIPDEFRLR